MKLVHDFFFKILARNHVILLFLNFTENILNVDDPGRALWMTREEYVTFGTQTLAITDHLLDEDG